MSNRVTVIIAIVLLIFMFVVAVTSMAGDSLTMDELSHLPAGYSYLTQKDMRINPEHPPLIKDLSAVPLLFVQGINFPSDVDAWKNEVNSQWTFGYHFLYTTGNPVEKIMFWARIPMILILLILGIYVFWWARKLFGNGAGLLSLFLFSFSPTLLAHGRLVTTDVGAAAGAFIAAFYFIKFLKDPSRKNLIISGIFLGLAELAKFSLILLLPFFGVLIFFWAIAKSENFAKFLKIFCAYLLRFALVLAVGYALVWLFYLYHTWNYPPQKQAQDTQFILASSNLRPLADLTVWMADKPVLRPAAQYMLGLLMVFQRASGGNNGYFLGEVSASGWKNYFPVVYLIKEPLAFFVLLAISLLYVAWLVKKTFWLKPFQRAKNWMKNHFSEFAMLLFVGIYWFTSLSSNLNIGVRHLLPVFPFTILLVSASVSLWMKGAWFKKTKTAVLAILLIFQAYSVLAVYPYFIAYFNELVGGPSRGYIYVTDSNLDWGQDMIRLRSWLEEKGVDKVYVDYFGGSDTSYFLGDKYLAWWGSRDPKELPKGSYLAVSATFLQGGRGFPVPGYESPTGYYLWLDKYTPVAAIGHSIFVYRVD